MVAFSFELCVWYPLSLHSYFLNSLSYPVFQVWRLSATMVLIGEETTISLMPTIICISQIRRWYRYWMRVYMRWKNYLSLKMMPLMRSLKISFVQEEGSLTPTILSWSSCQCHRLQYLPFWILHSYPVSNPRSTFWLNVIWSDYMRQFEGMLLHPTFSGFLSWGNSVKIQVLNRP